MVAKHLEIRVTRAMSRVMVVVRGVYLRLWTRLLRPRMDMGRSLQAIELLVFVFAIRALLANLIHIDPDRIHVDTCLFIKE